MKRIIIIGISGSGKSTFAKKLGNKLNRSVIHLDKLFWTKEWKRRYTLKGEWAKTQRDIVKLDEWIIDGNFNYSLDIRLERADTVIYFDIPRWCSLWRSFMRIFNKEQPFDKTEGIKEKMSWQLIKNIIKYPKKETEKLLSNYRDKTIYVVKNNRDIEKIFNEL